MKFKVEFYRTRVADSARATIGQETIIASALDEAIALAIRLSTLLNMPQQPDAMAIIDGEGHELYSHRFDQNEPS